MNKHSNENIDNTNTNNENINNSNEDYDVGYKKPPANGQFQKGQSGNPRGRPKGHRNYSTILNEALNETVVVKENGQKSRISKLEATVKQLVNAAAQGDYRARQQLLPLVQAMYGDSDSDNGESRQEMLKMPKDDFAKTLLLRMKTLEDENDDAK